MNNTYLGEAICMAKAAYRSKATADTKKLALRLSVLAAQNDVLDEEEEAKLAEAVLADKKIVFAKCFACPHPCGNKDAYDVRRFLMGSDGLSAAKRNAWQAAVNKAEEWSGARKWAALTEEEADAWLYLLRLLSLSKKVTVEELEIAAEKLRLA